MPRCNYCKTALAREGVNSLLCEECEKESNDFFSKFMQNEKVDRWAEWLAGGLIGGGLLMIAALNVWRAIA